MKRISVDIGGTFTDCVLAWEGERIEKKSPTTHHDLTEGLLKVIGEIAAELGKDVDTVLSQVDSVRYGTTLGTNALIERSGERVGLITTEGHEDTVEIARGFGYGDGLPPVKQLDIAGATKPDRLVPSKYRYPLRERIDYNGDVLMEPDREEIREIANDLIDDGVRAIAVVLLNSTHNPEHEKLVRDVIIEEYPSNVLGSTPVVLSHQVTRRHGEYMRSNATIINAYLHRTMREGLKNMQKVLRERGYDKPIQLVHNDFGMAQLGKTFAIQTVDAGPVAGLGASRQLSQELDAPNLITADMGGTSFDIGLVTDGDVNLYEYEPVIDRLRVNIPMVYMETIGAGGGSVIQYDEIQNSIKVGPESMGSDPGPACYNRGGRHATTTDIDAVLGYINPDYFWGGQLELDPRLAKRAVKRDIADPMGTSIDEAAAAGREIIDNKMAQAMFNEVSLQGHDPRKFSILAYGGAGPTHACGFAEELGVEEVILPPHAPVLSAAGAGNLDQQHMYEQSVFMTLYHGEQKTYFSDYEEFNSVVEELKEKGERDLVMEGFDPSEIEHDIEVDMQYGNQVYTNTATVPEYPLEGKEDLLQLLKSFRDSYGETFGDAAHMPELGIRLRTIRVQSYVDRPKMAYTQDQSDRAVADGSGEMSPTTHRQCYFDDRFQETPVYRADTLADTTIDGPAIVEYPLTTVVVDSNWEYSHNNNSASYLRNYRQ